MASQWDEELADIVEELIRLANCNQAPATEAEWHDICERFGVDLYLVHTASRHAGLVLDDVILVKRAAQPEQTQQRIAHELSEYLLCSDWHAPVVVPMGSLDAQRHHIAGLVEKRVRAMQSARRHSVEQQMQAIARRRTDLEHRKQTLDQRMQRIQAQIAAETRALEAAAHLLEQM